MNPFKNDWRCFFDEESRKDYYLSLREFLIEEYREKTIYPDMYHLFTAMHKTSLKDTKVVILGQDPYHGPRQAHGLSFSVQPGVRLPPSLLNVYKELQSDLKIPRPKNGCLLPWAEQGILLLNTVLTVRAGEANSHRNIGWEKFTDSIIKLVNKKSDPVMFILWGVPASKKKVLITNSIHSILTSAHPSPLSADRGFFGSKPFSKTNEFLKSRYGYEINWSI